MTMGHDRREEHATGRNMKRRKEVKLDVMKGKFITWIMIGRKGGGKKTERQGKYQRPGRCKMEALP